MNDFAEREIEVEISNLVIKITELSASETDLDKSEAYLVLAQQIQSSWSLFQSNGFDLGKLGEKMKLPNQNSIL